MQSSDFIKWIQDYVITYNLGFTIEKAKNSRGNYSDPTINDSFVLFLSQATIL